MLKQVVKNYLQNIRQVSTQILSSIDILLQRNVVRLKNYNCIANIISVYFIEQEGLNKT